MNILPFDNDDDTLGLLPVGGSIGVSVGAGGSIGVTPTTAGGSIGVGGAGGSIGVSLASREVVIQVTGVPTSFLGASVRSGSTNAGYIRDALNARGWTISGVVAQSTTSWLVTAHVRTTFSDSVIIRNVTRDLGDLLSSVSAAIVRAGSPTYVSLSSNAAAQVANIANPGQVSPLDAFLGSFGAGLGISTPVALIAGGLLLLIVLKK